MRRPTLQPILEADRMRALHQLCLVVPLFAVNGTIARLPAAETPTATNLPVPDLPEEGLAIAYTRAASQNVVAAVNPKVLPGYFSL